MESSILMDIYSNTCLETDSSIMSASSTSSTPELKPTHSAEIVHEGETNITTDESLISINDRYTNSTNNTSTFTNNDGLSDVFSSDNANYEYILDKLADFKLQINIEKKQNRILKGEMKDIQQDFTKFIIGFAKFENDQTNTCNDIDDLYERVYSLDCLLSECDQYTRRENLVISGIPEFINQQNLEYEVLKILKTIGVNNVSSYHIVACHRLKKNNNDKYPARTIVRFTNRKIVESCLFKRERLLKLKKELKMNIRFYENLTKSNEKNLKECQNLYRHEVIQNYYIRNGFMKIVINQGDKAIKIIHQDILDNLFADFYEYDNLYSP